MSNDKVLAYDVFAQVNSYLTQPTLLIVGQRADSLYHSEPVYQNVQGIKEYVIIEGASHIDLYDKSQYVTQAVSTIVMFFTKHL